MLDWLVSRTSTIWYYIGCPVKNSMESSNAFISAMLFALSSKPHFATFTQNSLRMFQITEEKEIENMDKSP